MFDLVIENGYVIDGSGNPWFKANVAIQDGKIVKVSRSPLNGKKTINAKGLVVAPGFCDLHTHTDSSILVNKYALSSIHQGVTTEGVGQCGTGTYCYADGFQAQVAMEIAQMTQTPPSELNINWRTLGEFRQAIHKNGTGINLAPYIPRGTLRMSVMGEEGKGGERYEPTAEEMAKMKELVAEGMRDGAFGMSTGLRYPWGRNSFTEEVIEMTKVVSEHSGIYISHMRSESDTLIESVHELIEICEKAGVPGCISHHKTVFPENFGKTTETLRLVDEARKRGTEIMIDFYPWTHAAEGNLGGAFLPYYFTPDMTPEQLFQTMDNLIELLKDDAKWEEVKNTARDSFNKENEANKERIRILAERDIKAPALWHPAKFNYIVHSPNFPELNHKNLHEAAKILGIPDFWDAARKIYIEDNGKTLTAGGIMHEEDIKNILRHPTSAISTDGAAFDQIPDTSSPIAWAHPRNFGTFSKVLGQYARDEKVISLEEGVRKMTSLPLRFLGIMDRGLVREGMWADITIFDADKIANKATFANPGVYPEGIHYVMVNGEIALEEGIAKKTTSGRVLSRLD